MLPGAVRLMLLRRLPVPRAVRRREMERLFAMTAGCFGVAAPPGKGTLEERLCTYARFTGERAAGALARGEAPETRSALYHGARALGERYRRRLGLRSSREALAAAVRIYRCLGIDMRSDGAGQITVLRCAFSRWYTPETCALISALDEGLLAGLTGGGELRFSERITSGSPACRARLAGGSV
jgi:hypothetical protein